MQHELYRKIREHRGDAAAGAVAALARARGPAQPAHPLRAVVGRRRRGARRSWRWRSSVYYARLGSAAAPVQAALASVGLEDVHRAACRRRRRRADAQAAAGAGGGARRRCSVEEDGGRTRVTLLRRRPVRVRAARRSNPRLRRRCCGGVAEALEPGAGPRARGRAHRRSAAALLPVSRQLRAVARARRERRPRCCSAALDNPARLECDRRRLVAAAVSPESDAGEPGAQSARRDRPRARSREPRHVSPASEESTMLSVHAACVLVVLVPAAGAVHLVRRAVLRVRSTTGRSSRSTGRLIAIALVVGALGGVDAARSGCARTGPATSWWPPSCKQAPARSGRAPRRCSCASGSKRRSRALKQKRRGGHSLYDLPWYVIIGAPGSGKTTALVNSGLHFPLEQRIGQGRAARRRRHAQLRLVVHRRGGVPRHRRPLHDAGFRRGGRQRRLDRVPRAAAQVPQAPAGQRRHPRRSARRT